MYPILTHVLNNKFYNFRIIYASIRDYHTFVFPALSIQYISSFNIILNFSGFLNRLSAHKELILTRIIRQSIGSYPEEFY